MIKAVLLDVDGVILKKRKKHFSQRLAKDYGIKVPMSFFRKIYPKVRVGRADLKSELAKRMREWGWQKSVEELLNYWFSPENRINNQVLDSVQKLRRRGIKCYIISDNSKYRADDLMKNVLGNFFDGGFFSCNLGHTKEEKKFFKIVLKKINLKPEDILFVDDEKGNTEVAKSVRINAFFYESFEDFKGILLRLIKKI